MIAKKQYDCIAGGLRVESIPVDRLPPALSVLSFTATARDYLSDSAGDSRVAQAAGVAQRERNSAPSLSCHDS